jgi:molybdopterin molybdotransferase
MSLLPLDEAQRRLLALVRPVDPETVPLADAVGRWAGTDIHATRAQPVTDLSAMDGYAIRFADLPGPWRVVGEIAAGLSGGPAIGAQEAVRIFTGAPMPSGADTVLIQEYAARDGDTLSLAGDPPAATGANVRVAGSNFPAAATLVRRGERLRPARIALAALAGHGRLTVNRRIRVAILSTGDELVPPGAHVGDSQIHASNGVMLAAMLADLPCEISDPGLIPDREDALVDAFAAARDADIIVTSGGASVGDHDLVRPALIKAGATMDFWRVAMRPGKPLMAGRLGDCAVLGLPGNPVSAFVTATLFLKPLVAALAGAADPLPQSLHARLGAALPANGDRADFVRARMDDGVLNPLASRDSAALLELAGADALIVRPTHAPAAAAGDMVAFLPIA